MSSMAYTYVCLYLINASLKGSHGYEHTHDGASGFQLLYRIVIESVSEHLRELSFLLVRFVGERFDPGGTVITRSAAVAVVAGSVGVSRCLRTGRLLAHCLQRA